VLDLMRQLTQALEWPGVILVVAGVVLAIVRAITGPGHARWTLLVSFPVLYFTVVAWHGFTSDTVLLPLLPAAVVLAANAVVSGVSLLRRFDIPRAARTTLIAALTVLAVLPPAVYSIALVRQAGLGRR
jgi:fucose 4-O-acetylase-like acetyltransferase